MKKFIAAFLLSMALLPSLALAQTCPAFTYGLVLTPAQWQSCFNAKQNALGFTPVNRAGDTMFGRLITIPSSTTSSGLNLPHGAAPSVPVNGDVWTTSAGLFARISGSTVGLGAGSVSSVGLSMPSIFSVTGSPVTSSGTLAASLTNQAINTVFAGPSTGSSAAPTFRALVGADLPLPASSTLGGIKSKALIASQFLTSLGTDGALTAAQPAASDLSNGTTGSGPLVLATSPTLATPTIGVATATSINKVAITAPATSATLTIANGKTLTANASLTLAGTDATTMTFPATTDTVVGLAASQTLTNKTLTSPVLNTPTFSANAVPNTALAQMAASTIKGNNTGSTANASDVNAATFGSSMVLIQSQTASNSATIDFTTGITSAYDDYVIEITSMVPATNAVSLFARVSEDGGATWKAGAADYGWTRYANADGGAIGAAGAASDTSMAVTGSIGNGAGATFNGTLKLRAPSGSTFKILGGEVNYYNSTPSTSVGSFTGSYKGTTNAINGVRFLMSAGNITSGIFKLYGIRKS